MIPSLKEQIDIFNNLEWGFRTLMGIEVPKDIQAKFFPYEGTWVLQDIPVFDNNEDAPTQREGLSSELFKPDRYETYAVLIPRYPESYGRARYTTMSAAHLLETAEKYWGKL